jgi:hypothetical protein
MLQEKPPTHLMRFLWPIFRIPDPDLQDPDPNRICNTDFFTNCGILKAVLLYVGSPAWPH